MKSFLVVTIILLVFSVSMVYAEEKPAEGKKQTICPVMKMPIEKNLFVDYQGNRIYFCCDKCPKTFLDDPDKYMKVVKEMGVTLEKTPNAQEMCPVLPENKITKENFVDYQGKRIYFCCNKCPVAFMKEPDKYMKALKEKGINLDDTPKPQSMCPVMDMEVEKEYYADHEGKRIYFCCDKCPIAFKKDPAKYMKILKEKGYNLENAPIIEKEKVKEK